MALRNSPGRGKLLDNRLQVIEHVLNGVSSSSGGKSKPRNGMVTRRSVDDPLPTPPPPPPPPPPAPVFEETNGDDGGNDVPSLVKSVKEQGTHPLEFVRMENLCGNWQVDLLWGDTSKFLMNRPQVSSLEARGRRQQKKGASGIGSGSNNRRSKSENPLQRKLSVAQHLSLTTRPQVSLRHFSQFSYLSVYRRSCLQ